jgi:vacuolar iron transporter family protein
MDPRHLEHGHNPRDIAKRLHEGPRVSYLRDWVYGGIDGTVTTFAVVAGVVGAELSTKALLILGAANLFADGFSMAAANYSGTKAEIGEYEKVRRMEERHVELAPEGEREEVRQIFAAKGFTGEALDTAVDVITAKRDRWIETMMTEEHGLPTIARSPGKAAIMTFLAFVICGSVPLLPFIASVPASVWRGCGFSTNQPLPPSRRLVPRCQPWPSRNQASQSASKRNISSSTKTRAISPRSLRPSCSPNARRLCADR